MVWNSDFWGCALPWETPFCKQLHFECQHRGGTALHLGGYIHTICSAPPMRHWLLNTSFLKVWRVPAILRTYQTHETEECVRHLYVEPHKEEGTSYMIEMGPIRLLSDHPVCEAGDWQRPLDCPRGFSLSLIHCWCGLLSSDPGAWFCRGTPKRPPACLFSKSCRTPLYIPLISPYRTLQIPPTSAAAYLTLSVTYKICNMWFELILMFKTGLKELAFASTN